MLWNNTKTAMCWEITIRQLIMVIFFLGLDNSLKYPKIPAKPSYFIRKGKKTPTIILKYYDTC